MFENEFQSLELISESLWSEPHQAHQYARDTLAAISLRPLTQEQIIRKTSAALIHQAEQQGQTIHERALNHPFFRLLPKERLILVALHKTRWSYQRLSSILNESIENIERIAWNARFHLALTQTTKRIRMPGAPKNLSLSCPEYDEDRPWTQRLLDGETKGQSKHFLLDHVKRCAGCQQSLESCKELFYSIQSFIPNRTPDFNQDFLEVWKESQKKQGLSHQSTKEYLEQWLSRKENLFLVLLFFTVTLFWLASILIPI
ncbi:MAG: hypothetical protein CL678_06320 [Bdellovibrionaceae bacterium]|nr:hypothetical protein [Pseudobdellovibrionaceae bacterium]|tara:strand:- start:576 stop:1352 length:777 start_codon:yes stop_codon:yes gene_type:complete